MLYGGPEILFVTAYIWPFFAIKQRFLSYSFYYYFISSVIAWHLSALFELLLCQFGWLLPSQLFYVIPWPLPLMIILAGSYGFSAPI